MLLQLLIDLIQCMLIATFHEVHCTNFRFHLTLITYKNIIYLASILMLIEALRVCVAFKKNSEPYAD